MSHRFVVVDLETTGSIYNRGDRIFQISLVIIEENNIVAQYTTLINPKIKIPPFVQELTGIDNTMLEHAPNFAEVAADIYDLLSDAIFVAHNVLFDLSFLQGELTEAGYDPFYPETIDTVELAKILLPHFPSYQLSELTDLLGFVHDRPHQADSDALVTAELLLYLIKKVKSLPIVTLDKLTELAFSLKSDIGILFQSILSDKMKNVENLPQDIEVFRGIALKKKELPKQNDALLRIEYPEQPSEKMDILHSYSSAYQKREQQFNMMDTVYEALNSNNHAVVEADTGIGKSLGYLLPSLYFALQENKTVVISTYTTQMQEQLLLVEIEKLKKMLPYRFQVSMLKGRSHYIHLLKFEQSLKETDNQYDVIVTKMQILVWLTVTDTGDLDEINFLSGGNLFKQRIKHDGWFFNSEYDPWLKKDFYLHARKTAERSNLIITNHAMLLIDSQEKIKILPDYEYLIIDEAHHIDQAARDIFGQQLEYTTLKFWLGRIGTLEKGYILKILERIIRKKELSPAVTGIELEGIVNQLNMEIDDLFKLLSDLILSHRQQHDNQYSKEQVRITNDLLSGKDWKVIILCVERVYDFLRKIKEVIESRLCLLKKEANNLTLKEKSILEEIHSFLVEWSKLAEAIYDFSNTTLDEQIIWIEGDLRALPNSASIRLEPNDISNLLQKQLFNVKKSVILTSATLTVNQTFDYFLQQVGLMDDIRLVKKKLPSPYDYKNKAKLLIATDLPTVRGTMNDHYIEAVANHLISITTATKGRILVLFTSYDMLKKTYSLIKESEALEDYMMLAQGLTSGSLTRLIKNFQRFNKAMLFGTNSLWEGIDIPGEDLSCLVIVRLPFSSPIEPVTAAKYEGLKKVGENPFTKYALPEAVLRFKQGIGRLIRSESDRGIMIVFDQRIITSSYGQTFIQSIPNIPVEQGDLKKIIRTIEDWL